MKRKRFQITHGHFLFLTSFVVVLAAFALLYTGLEFFRSEFPDTALLKTHYPRVIYNGPKRPARVVLEKSPPAGYTTVREISIDALAAVIVSEDWAFYQHKGYDPVQIKAAIADSIEAGTVTRGASTITQQVAKNVFLTQDRQLWRKIKELFLAIQMEKTVGKRKILETYFNIAEWGEGIFGIRAAAHFYFNKEPIELSAKEGAFLAMLLPSPKRYSQSYRNHALTPFARQTITSILKKMNQAHYLSDGELSLEISKPLSFEVNPQVVDVVKELTAPDPDPDTDAQPTAE